MAILETLEETEHITLVGLVTILEYLKESVDVLPWEEAKAMYDEIGFGPGESAKMTKKLERALSL